VPVIGLAVRWWDAGEGSEREVKKVLYTGSVVRVSARSSFIANLRNGGPPEWRTRIGPDPRVGSRVVGPGSGRVQFGQKLNFNVTLKYLGIGIIFCILVCTVV